MTQDWWLNALWSVVPTIIIGILFGTIIWAALNADRKTRRDYSQIEREEREARARARTDGSSPTG